MFFDTAHNSRRTVLANIYAACAETAAKMWAYARCLAPASRPGTAVLVGEFTSLLAWLFKLLLLPCRLQRCLALLCPFPGVVVRWEG